jgi:hypothetical protein
MEGLGVTERATARGSLAWGAVIALVAILFGIVLVNITDDSSSVDSEERTEESSTSTSAPPPIEPPLSTTRGSSGEATWQGELASLTVAPEPLREGYDRDLFKHWTDADGDGCDTRCEVLERQRVTTLPGLAAGGWLSIYDGYSTDDSSEFDVDHVVALGEAWDSGASGWNDERREAFANDLDSGQLVAVTAATNRSKSDRDPADWQPPNRDAWCEWGAAWIEVKAKWDLTADRAELDALTNIMRGCP